MECVASIVFKGLFGRLHGGKVNEHGCRGTETVKIHNRVPDDFLLHGRQRPQMMKMVFTIYSVGVYEM